MLPDKLHGSVLEKMMSAYAYHRIVTDEQGIPFDYEYLEVNAAFETFTGINREQAIGRTVRELIPALKSDAFDWVAFFGRVALTGQTEITQQYSDTLQRWYLVQAYSFAPGYFATVFMDITAMKTREDELIEKNEVIQDLYHNLVVSEEKLRQQMGELSQMSHEIVVNEARLNRAQALARVGNWEIDLASHEIWASAEAFRLYGLERETPYLLLTDAQRFVMPEDRHAMDEALQKLLTERIKYDIQFRVITADRKEIRHMHSVAELEFDYFGKPARVLGVVQDVSERVHYLQALETKHEELLAVHEELTATEEELRQQYEELQGNQELMWQMAHIDVLTGLPNRTLWEEQLATALAQTRHSGLKVAVIFIDLDHFKQVNDTMGHAKGDELLQLIAHRLSSVLRDTEMLARFGGDEFLILSKNVASIAEVSLFLAKLVELFQQPYFIQGLSINISASIGVALYPDEGSTEDELLQNADTAMYRAKELGRNRFEFFNLQMKQDLMRKTDLERKMRAALSNQEFLLYYQPQFDVRTGKLRGFEALIRWEQPQLGFLNPLEFIPLAEDSGLILPIGQWVLNTACATGQRLTAKYGLPVTISVNISTLQLQQGDFEETVWRAIYASGFSPSQLELEITESVLIRNFEQTLTVLCRLQEAGFKIALDDFGTGYSSLSYLKILPINTLKIDKSFIQEINLATPENDLTAAIISLVHSLNIETIAEGVENQRQLEYLHQAGCDGLQGFYLGRPVPEESLDRIFLHEQE
ncbi:MAG: EAL domain-containing protein [Peptococcaceae bacterium]|nr:EAL domain-containing protein [Peptococcaceae bacterium]